MKRFLLLGCDTPVPGLSGQVAHYNQKTGYTCGAACVSMITGLTEEDSRKLARTTRTGTSIGKVAAGLNSAGFRAHLVPLHGAFEDHLPELVLQSHRWPLYLSLEFLEVRQYESGRTRKRSRYHAVVLSGGLFLDPGEWHELDPEAIGHLHQRGVRINSYVLVESARS